MVLEPVAEHSGIEALLAAIGSQQLVRRRLDRLDLIAVLKTRE